MYKVQGGKTRKENSHIQLCYSCRVKYFACLLAIFWYIFCCAEGSVRAENTRFVRIYTMSDVVSGNYLIGAFSRVSSAVGMRSYLMSSVSADHKRKAVSVDLQDREIISDAESNCIWQLQKADDGLWHILSANSQLGLTASWTTDLELTSSYDDWIVRFVGNGAFEITDGTQRRIGLNSAASGVYFGRYLPQVVDTVYLALYRAMEHINSSYVPQDGDTVSLAAMLGGTAYAYCTADSLCDVGDFLTVNNRLAHGVPSCRYIVESYMNDSDSAFSLRTLNDAYLRLSEEKGIIVLRESEIPQPWGMDEISLFSLLESDTIRVYAKSDAGHHLSLTCNADGPAVSLLPCSASAITKEFKPHCVSLSGAYSMPTVDSLLQEDRYRAYDFSAADLPQRFCTKSYSFDNSNRLFYCLEEQLASLPENLGNVIAGAEGIYNAAGPITWIDRVPLSISYSFGLNGEVVKYVRQACLDGGWETLYLPFACSTLPNNFHFEQYVGIEDRYLRFEPATEIQANVPYVFRYTGNPLQESVAELVLTSDNGQILSNCQEESVDSEYAPMAGTYEDIYVDNSNAGNFYFLNAEGTNFVRAAAGSILHPFRLYLDFADENPVGYVVYMKTNTGIISGTGQGPNDEIYDLCGRRLKRRPHGFYIQNGHKMYNLK